MKQIEKEILYNLLHYVIALEHPVAPLEYTDQECVFSVLLPDHLKGVYFLEKVKRLLEDLEDVVPLYEVQDPRSLYGDVVPVLEENILKFNPFGNFKFNFKELKPTLKIILNTLKTNKKSRSLKYYF